MDDLVLKVPLFGDLIRKAAVAKFTRTTGTMLSSGVAILDALEIVAKTAGNKTIEKAVFDTRTAIAEGRTMSDPLLKRRLSVNGLPDDCCRRIHRRP